MHGIDSVYFVMKKKLLAMIPGLWSISIAVWNWLSPEKNLLLLLPWSSWLLLLPMLGVWEQEAWAWETGEAGRESKGKKEAMLACVKRSLSISYFFFFFFLSVSMCSVLSYYLILGWNGWIPKKSWEIFFLVWGFLLCQRWNWQGQSICRVDMCIF